MNPSEPGDQPPTRERKFEDAARALNKVLKRDKPATLQTTYDKSKQTYSRDDGAYRGSSADEADVQLFWDATNALSKSRAFVEDGLPYRGGPKSWHIGQLHHNRAATERQARESKAQSNEVPFVVWRLPTSSASEPSIGSDYQPPMLGPECTWVPEQLQHNRPPVAVAPASHIPYRQMPGDPLAFGQPAAFQVGSDLPSWPTVLTGAALESHDGFDFAANRVETFPMMIPEDLVPSASVDWFTAPSGSNQWDAFLNSATFPLNDAFDYMDTATCPACSAIWNEQVTTDGSCQPPTLDRLGQITHSDSCRAVN